MDYIEEFRLAYLADGKDGRAIAEKKIKALFLRCKRDKFTPPSLQEVRDYVREMQYGMDPEQFWNFYCSKGWKVGRNQMADWKASVRGWESRDKQQRPNRPVNSNSYVDKWAKRAAARKKALEEEERTRQETLDSIWKEAGVDRSSDR